MSSISTNGLAFSGLSSGIDTTSLINGILAIQQLQVTNLQTKVKSITAQQTAFDAVESDILNLQNQTSALSQSVNGVFDGRTATPSNASLVAAAAGAGATPGIYTFTINQLAQPEQVASQGFDGPTSAIAQGTYQIQVGTGTATNITVDSTNDTLQGLANAINNSGGDVTASIVNDGAAAGTQPFRLLLTSNVSGAANTVAVTFTAGSGGGVNPEFNATSINDAVAGNANTGTAALTSNAGAGAYTGSTNNTYTFTVANGGTVSGGAVTLNYTDSTGANHGVITVNGTGAAQGVAQGLQIAVGPGTLTAGDTFTVSTFVPNVQQAADASLSIGSGPGALTVASDSNQVDNLISGVTLKLLAADPNNPVSVTVANNVTAATTAVQNFVTAYNTLITDVNTQTAFNSTTQSAGQLLGDGDVISITNQISSAVNGVVAGLGPQINNLSAVGVTVNSDGTLNLDTNTLSQALNGQLPGVTYADVKQLFALGGQSNNNGVQFLLGTDKTQASGTPYQANITQAATQASISSTQALNASTSITSGADTLILNVNGQTSDPLTLAPGTYTPLQIAQQLQNLINNDSALAGNQVAVALNGGVLQITSQLYGSNSTVSVVGGSGAGSLYLSGAPASTGQNVAGTFSVNGSTEQATGTGQTLTGNSGNANTDGLAVDVTLTAAQILTGNNTANVTVTRGIASSLDLTLSGLTDPVTGRLKAIDQSYTDQIANVNTQITQDNTEFTDEKNSLTTQFANMEVAINALKTVGLEITAFANSSSGLSNSSGSSSSSSSSSLPSIGSGTLSSGGSGSSGSSSSSGSGG